MEIKTSYTLPIEQDGDDLILSFPDEMMESIGWQVGDTVIWSENKDGTWTLSKAQEDGSNI